MNFLVKFAVISAAVVLVSSSGAQASVLFTGDGTVGANTVTASATFTISGTTLTIALQNTSPAADQEMPTNTLTGVTFLLDGLDPVLTPLSAISPNAIFDAAACDVSSCTGTNVNVGGEWGYQRDYHGLEAIGSSGYIATGLAHDLGNFGGPDLESPTSLDGIEFGIISANHGPFNGGLTGQALIQDTIDLTLTIPAGFSESQIATVSLLYGTAPDGMVVGIDPLPPAVPEPASIVILGTSLIGAGLMRRRRRRYAHGTA